MTISLLTVPTVKPESIKSVEENQESYVVQDKIMSFIPTENGQKLIVRHKFGITEFSLNKPKTDNIYPSESSLRPNCPKRDEIQIDNLGPFPPEPIPEDTKVKSEALKFMYAFGLAVCENTPSICKGVDFTKFDSLCTPASFTINISWVTNSATTITGEPSETRRFSNFS